MLKLIQIREITQRKKQQNLKKSRQKLKTKRKVMIQWLRKNLQ